MTQDSVKAKFNWEEHNEMLRRSKAYQAESATSLKPFVQLLSFSVVSSNKEPAVVATSTTEGLAGTENQTQGSNLMRNLTGNRFNLRFWQRSSSGEKAAEKDVSSKLTTTSNGKMEEQRALEKT